MHQATDTLGNAYTVNDSNSVNRLVDIVTAYLGSRNTVMPLLDDLLRTDPTMPMAICLRAYLLKLASDPRLGGPIQRSLESLEALGDSLNPREQLHLQALRYWVANQLQKTVNALESLLSIYPRDMLALRLAHYLHFYAGSAKDMRASVSRSLHTWDPNDPYYGYLLGMHSFGLEESGDYEEAEAYGKQAIDNNPADIWAAHAVTHVFQMQQRFNEGIEWIDSLVPQWESTNNFIYHLHWHQALCHIGLEDYERALSIYDNHLAKAVFDDFYLDTCNAASLLWRLEILGVDVAQRWQALQTISAARVGDNELIFSTLHYLMAPARLKDQPALDQALSSLLTWSQSNTTQGDICREVGLPIAKALISIGKGDAHQAATDLKAIQHKIYLIGGSHAQRDLFTQIQQFGAGF
jgi:tetratricopeptide (TPR) repeat protein